MRNEHSSLIFLLQSPGVQSMKPSMGEVLEALERMVNYTGWSSIAITKSRFGKLSNHVLTAIPPGI